MNDLKEQARTVFIARCKEDGIPPAWWQIEFENWWKNEKKEWCINKANKNNTTRCYTPCDHCRYLRAQRFL
jgi:hypothetical protein